MRITIIRSDGMLGKDGDFKPVDLSSLDSRVSAVQWDTAKNEGHIELENPRENVTLLAGDFAPYQQYVDVYDNTPPPPERERPTDDEVITAEVQGVFTRQLIRHMANKQGITPTELIAEIKRAS